MESITATYEDMRRTATEVDTLADDYENLYQRFLSEVEKLTKTDFKGIEADTFYERVNGFRDDFSKMKQLMNDYATFIRQTADSYEETQNNLKQQASALQN